VPSPPPFWPRTSVADNWNGRSEPRPVATNWRPRDALMQGTLCDEDYRRASWMLSDIVRSGVRQKLRAIAGGTTARQPAMIQWVEDVIPIATAAPDTTTTHPTSIAILTFSEYMSRV